MENSSIETNPAAYPATIEQEAPTVTAPPPEPPVRNARNQDKRVGDPKVKQFTGRSTKDEYERINDAIELRKQVNKPYDIVRLCLDMMDHIEKDFLQTFKTKKKR